MRAINSIFIFLAMALSTAGAAPAWAEEPAPTIRGPRFPLEPGKHAERPIRPETYVAGATSAPIATGADDLPIARLSREGDRWVTSLGIGWSFANQISKHRFSGAIGSVNSARRSGTQPLTIDLDFEILPPISTATVRNRDFGVSFATLLGITAGYGKADFKPIENPAAIVRETVTGFGAGAGLRLRLLFAGGTHAFWLGPDARYERGTALALAPGLTTVRADTRTVLSAVPRFEYRYNPDANWGVELGGGYGVDLSSSGDSGAAATRWKRVEADARALRHLSASTSLGMGASWARETSDWTSNAAAGVTDSQSSNHILLQLILRNYF